MRKIQLTGKIFGELQVIGPSESSRNGASKWHCRCSCGNETTVYSSHLLRGNTTSCGHIMRRSGARNFKGVGDMPKSYFSSVQRGAMGGKGRKPISFDITMEYIWEIFVEQRGFCALSNLPIDFKSKTASLDRVDSSLGYVEGNLQWLHKDINMMKRHYSTEYFKYLCKLIADGCEVVDI